MTLLPKILPSKDRHQATIERKLIRFEAELGGKLFGALPKGHKRQFFCIDENTWIWHETWMQKGQRKSMTTRYIIQPDGVFKLQDGQTYQRLSKREARRLYQAIKLYSKQVRAEYRHLLYSSTS